MSEFPFPGSLIRVDYPSFLSQHDVVYHAPVPDGCDGLPVGNGDLGAIIWTPPDRLQFNINKVDLFDDGPDGDFDCWGDPDNETQTMPRHAGSLSIRNGLPCYDRLYLTDFEGRLRLAKAQVEWRAATPFSKVRAETFISQSARVIVVHYQDETEEPLPRQIELARWGTRSLIHWYSVIGRSTPISLMGTQAGCDGVHLWIAQPLRDMNFVIAARVDGPARPRLLHHRAGVFESEPVRHFESTIYVAVAHNEETDDPLATALKRVDDAAREGKDNLKEVHQRSWQKFWEASFVDLPPEQDYIENLWYLNSYAVGSACRGKYPPNHISALWGWNRDVFPWCQYYHWNNQMHVYSLHSSGHADLALPYFRYRRAMLDHAIVNALQFHNCSGAYYNDVANRKGFQDTSLFTRKNLTPGPQIAIQFWQHYQYTLEEDFLKNDAYPVIREVTRFYLEKLTQDQDGHYSFVGTIPYESVLSLRNTITDLAHARQLFTIFVEASNLLGCDGEDRLRCQAVLNNLSDFPTAQVSTEFWVPNPPANMPDWNGDAVPVHFKELTSGEPTMPIWLLGNYIADSHSAFGQEFPDGAPIHEGSRDPLKQLWIMTSCNMAPIFPANLIGLDQSGSPDFITAMNTVRAFGYDTQSFSLYMIARARLGMAQELQLALAAWPQRFQIFPQGFFHYMGFGHPTLADGSERETSKIRVVGSPDEQIFWPVALSNHMSLEGGPVLQLAINEMLLQSYSGTLRVFPAVPGEWQGAFRLHAAGGFVISAVKNEDGVSYVIIESIAGRPCRLANPLAGQSLRLYTWDIEHKIWIHSHTLTGEIFTISTEKDGVYLLLPEGKQPEKLVPISISGSENQQFKELGKARLGIPKGF